MSKLFISNILVLLLIMISCSKNDDLSKIEGPQPKHQIYGNWKSEFLPDGPNFIIEFQENNLLRVENKNCSDCVGFYSFKILDENTVEFDYSTNLVGEMMVMKVSVLQTNNLKTQCKNKSKPNAKYLNARYLIDANILCAGNWKFKRIQ